MGVLSIGAEDPSAAQLTLGSMAKIKAMTDVLRMNFGQFIF
jgi:hypothetical protein